MTKYIFITGGVVSSLGKGICGSSLAALLKLRGYRVHMRKFDPYLNVDPGTMSPYQHGEVFVTEDGAETDLDLGHYERFTDQKSLQSDSVSSGQIYRDVIDGERRGDYLGATIQVIPHVTDMIKHGMLREIEGSDPVDFCIIEIGGTVGDIEGLPFLEAIRQLRSDLGRERTLFVHVTLVPYIAAAGEIKTKPSQHSVKELLGLGIQPDMLVCRTSVPLPTTAKEKLALFCNIKPENVITAEDAATIYAVPLGMHAGGFDAQVLRHFAVDPSTTIADLKGWEKLVSHICTPCAEVTIGIVAKYPGLVDAYKSINESLVHAGAKNNARVNIQWIDSEALESVSDAKFAKELAGVDGLLIPGGFGHRGVEGKIRTITHARCNNVPILGICLGMQMMVVEAARNLLDLDAGSSEFGSYESTVVGLMTEWIKDAETINRHTRGNLGGTMRLGAYACVLKKGTHAHALYGKASEIHERHRHRYEVDTAYIEPLEEKGLIFSGMSPDGKLPEIVEMNAHPFYIGVQFHPEFLSRPVSAHPLFDGLVKAALAKKTVSS